MVEMNLYEIQQWKERIEKHIEELFAGVEQLTSEVEQLTSDSLKFDAEFSVWKQRMSKPV